MASLTQTTSVPNRHFDGGANLSQGSSTQAAGLGHLAEILQRMIVDLGLINAEIGALSNTVDYKDSVRVASTGNVNVSSPGASIDGVSLSSGDRVLLKDQSSAAENGIYVWNGAASAMTRAEDFDANSEVTAGAIVFVSEGTANGNNSYILTTNDTITVGSTSLTFTQLPNLTEVAANTLAIVQNGAKANARTASQVNQNVSSPGASIESVTLASGDRVLLMGQSSAAENGLWVWNGAAVPMTRPTDYPTGTAVVTPNVRVMVSEGTLAGTMWRLLTTGTIDVDTTSTVWTQFGVYVDPWAIQSAIVSLNTADILALHTTPKVLVAAPGPGFFVEFISAKFVGSAPTTALDDAAGQGNLQIGTATYAWANVESDGLVDVTAGNTASKFANPDGSSTQDRLLSNEALVLENDGTGTGAFTDPGGSDAALSVEVLYRVRSLT